MHTFKDNEGRAWDVSVNVAVIKRVRDLTGADLLGVVDGTLIEKLIRDPVLLCDVIYAACKPQADGRNINDVQFGEAMAGDAIDSATAALLSAIVDFCPSPRDRANLGRVVQKTNEVMDRARDLIEQRLESPELDEQIEKVLAQELASAGASSGNVPASSASIPEG